MTEGQQGRLPQCSFRECSERSETLVRFYDEEVEDDPEITVSAKWVMEYCGPHAGFAVSQYRDKNPKTLGPAALRQHWSALQGTAQEDLSE